MPPALKATSTDNRVNDIRYRIVSENERASTTFAIDSVSGELSLATGQSLNYEAVDEYILVVEATALRGTPEETTVNTTVTINVINELEATNFAFTANPYNLNVDENNNLGVNAGAPVEATVDDSDVTGIRYSIIPNADSANFAINRLTGQITVNAVLNHETKANYSFDVQASVLGSTVNSVVNIAVNDLPEATGLSFTKASYTGLVAENSAVNMSVDVTVQATATDTRANTFVRYSIVNGNTDALFRVDPVTGQIVVNNPALDFEKQSFYDLVLEAEALGVTANVPVRINIANLVETSGARFVGAPYTRSIAENSSVNTVVGFPIALTLDLGLTASYKIVSGNQAGNFRIHAQTGQLSVAGNLDRETVSSYVLGVVGTVNGDDKATDVTVNIVNVFDANDLSFTQNTYQFTVQENSVAGVNVGTPLQATSSDPAFVQEDVVYSIVSGNNDHNFVINANTSQITVATGANLDFEATNTYNLSVQAEITGQPVTTRVDVAINLTDVLDAKGMYFTNMPVADRYTDGEDLLPISLPENATVGSVIGGAGSFYGSVFIP